MGWWSGIGGRWWGGGRGWGMMDRFDWVVVAGVGLMGWGMWEMWGWGGVVWWVGLLVALVGVGGALGNRRRE